MTEVERAEKLRAIVKTFFDEESLKWLPEVARERLREEENLRNYLKLGIAADDGLNTRLELEPWYPVQQRISQYMAAQERGETELKFSRDELVKAASDEMERLQDEAVEKLRSEKSADFPHHSTDK